MQHLRFMAVLGATLVVAIVFAGAAFAQAPAAGKAYGGQAGGTLGEVATEDGESPASGTVASGTLPFTGIDLALLAMGGVVLTGVGAGLVRAGARK
jgi:hypothetical protein